MFQLGQGLRRIFGAETASALQDGLTGGDAGLLELLDLALLRREARSADVAAGRIGARDRGRRLIAAAGVWREVARRTGDAASLRRAAVQAEAACAVFDRRRRSDGWAQARIAQGLCALTGAELFGDEGLLAAAEVALEAARGAARTRRTAALAEGGWALVRARMAQAAQGPATHGEAAREAAAGLLRALDAGANPPAPAACLALAFDQIDSLATLAEGLRDRRLLDQALTRLRALGARLDPAYEPLLHARRLTLESALLLRLADLRGALEPAAEAVEAAAAAVAAVVRDHSPLDWARAEAALARALRAIGEATEAEEMLERAVAAYQRAETVLRPVAGLSLRAEVSAGRAACLARQAELTGDLAILDVAEAALKGELAAGAGRRDPVAWALIQTHLARLYLARVEITGHDRGQRAAAALALNAALDLFAEQGLGAFSAVALDGLERLRRLTIVQD